MIEHIQPEGFAVPAVPLSHATRAGDFVFVSGQIATDFATAPPARTTVVVALGHPDVRVEVDAVAYLG